MPIINEQIEYIKNELMTKFNPKDIYLFGSYAKGLITSREDDANECIKITGDIEKLVNSLI